MRAAIFKDFTGLRVGVFDVIRYSGKDSHGNSLWVALCTEPREDHAQYIQSWLRVLKADKKAIFTAEYRLDAYHDSNLKRRCPGFVIEHSCGLSLVHPSESDELGGADEDIRQRWLLTHTASGRGFGLTLNFKRATDALLLAASFPVDWTQEVATLETNPEFRRAGNTVIATYGRGVEKDAAKRRLAELERAA